MVTLTSEGRDGQTGRPGGKAAGGRWQAVGAERTWDVMNEIWLHREEKRSRLLRKR